MRGEREESASHPSPPLRGRHRLPRKTLVAWLVLVLNCFRSTSPPGGNLVDGLPPALSFGDLWTDFCEEIECSISDLVFFVCRRLLYLGCGQVSASEPQWRLWFLHPRGWFMTRENCKIKILIKNIDFRVRFRFEIAPGSSLRESSMK